MLFKQQRQALRDLGAVLPDVNDLDPASFFETVEEQGEVGFRNRDCSGNVILLPGPKEAEYHAHLHVEERYSTGTGHDLTFYRYEICWSFDIISPPNDYLRDSIVSLRRGVRFDHHPQRQDSDHPRYHWHPNGCSELRLKTGKMSVSIPWRASGGPPSTELLVARHAGHDEQRGRPEFRRATAGLGRASSRNAGAARRGVGGATCRPS